MVFGWCPYDTRCTFAHGIVDMTGRPFRGFVTCRAWRDVGVCYYGARCTFAHRKPSYIANLNVPTMDGACNAAMLSTRPASLDGFPTHEVLEPTKNELIAHIRELVAPLSPHGAFPGPNPCSIERADLSKKLTRYWVCEKTDGTRAMLVFLTYRGINVALLVTRAWDVYVASIRRVPKVLFQGTVFDGELISKRAPSSWLGFDAIFVAGIPVFGMTLCERLRAAERAMSAYAFDPADSLMLNFKTYFKDIGAYRAHAAGSLHPNDGHIFTPDVSPVVVGRHPGLFKMKTGGRHTVDFEFFNPDALRVYDPKRRECVRVGTLLHCKTGDLKDGCIAEAAWEGGSNWTLVTLRTDKDRSNDYLTYTKTLTNIRENLQLSDLEARWVAWA